MSLTELTLISVVRYTTDALSAVSETPLKFQEIFGSFLNTAGAFSVVSLALLIHVFYVFINSNLDWENI
jgi:hypothetical protein